MKINQLTAFVLLAPTLSFAQWNNSTGFLTPKSVTFQALGLSVVPVDSSNRAQSPLILWKGSKSITFSRSDTNFQRVEIGKIGVPPARYNAMCFEYSQANETIRVEGNKYEGTNASSALDNTTQYWSKSAGATTQNSLQTTSNTSGELTNVFASAGTATGSTNPNNEICASFPPACVTKRYPANKVDTNNKATETSNGCVAGDMVVRHPAKLPAVTILYDLYHYVGVDRSGVAGRKSPSYPVAVPGDSGVTIHLGVANASDGCVGDVALVFDDKGTLVYAASWTNSVSSCNTVLGQGIGSVTKSDGSYLNATYFNNSSAATTVAGISVGAGEVQFLLGGSGGARGALKLSDVRQACGTTITANSLTTANSVFKNETGIPTETNLSGFVAGSTLSSGLVVRKVVNPSSVSGFPATCAFSSAQADGYF